MAFQLLIARGNGEGQQFVVVQPVVRLGRDDDNDVVLSDAGVSRRHTRIFEREGRYWAEDLGSASGTLVNGEKVAAARVLKTGDALAIGAALINFVELDEPRARAVPSGVPVASKADTGEQLLPGRPGALPPPPAKMSPAGQMFDHDVITDSGEQPNVPWDESQPHAAPLAPARPRLYAEESEDTAPVGKALVFGDDSTVPAAKPLKLEPQTDLAVPKQPEPAVKGGPALVSASTLKRPFDTSEQKTSLAMPEPSPAPLPVKSVLEGPTRITGAPAGPAIPDPAASINRLLRDESRAGEETRAAEEPVEDPEESDSLAPLELSGSDLRKLDDATRADAKPLFDESTGQGQALPLRASAPRVTTALPAKETAADRARRRRHVGQSLGAQALHGWSELPIRTRAVLAAVSGLIVSVLIIGLVQFFRPEQVGPPLPSEPDRLPVSRERVRFFFGLGEGVEYPHSDSKEFSFDCLTPTEAAMLLHFRAQEIDRDEVAIIVNGADVGFVPADIGVPDREIEILIPQRVLKRGEKNILVFDNARNPPGKERWRVGEIWIELLPVPPASNADALKRAKELARQAGQLYAQRDIGTENVFRSWKAYRLAWQVLLVVPEEQRTTLFDQARRKSEDLAQELDRQCGALMLEAKKQMELKNPEKAKEILDSVSLYFPTAEHRCHALAGERLDEYQL